MHACLHAALSGDPDRQQLATVAGDSRRDTRDVADDPWSTIEARADNLDRHGSTNPRRTDDVRRFWTSHGEPHGGGRRRDGLVDG